MFNFVRRLFKLSKKKESDKELPGYSSMSGFKEVQEAAMPKSCGMHCRQCQIRCCGTCMFGMVFSNYDNRAPMVSVLCEYRNVRDDARFPMRTPIPVALKCLDYQKRPGN
jgi:hypothetical protein